MGVEALLIKLVPVIRPGNVNIWQTFNHGQNLSLQAISFDLSIKIKSYK